MKGVSVSEWKHTNNAGASGSNDNSVEMQSYAEDDVEEEAKDEKWEKPEEREPTISPLSSDNEVVQEEIGDPQEDIGDPQEDIGDPPQRGG